MSISNLNNLPAVICVHGVGLNGLGIVRSLGRRGITNHVIGIKGHANLASRSRYCASTFNAERFDGEVILDALLRLANRLETKPVLFFDNEQMVQAISSFADILEDHYSFTSPVREIQNMTDKLFQMQVARRAGLDVPAYWLPASWKELTEINTTSSHSLLAKPSPAAYPPEGLPFKTITAKDVHELEEKLKLKLQSPKDIIVQEYIEGADSEVYVALCYKSPKGDYCETWSAAKVRQSPAGAGIMAVGRAIDCEPVRSFSRKLIAALDCSGIVCTEFKYAERDGKYYFIELNPRMAQFHTIGRESGFDLPYIAYIDHARHSALNDIQPIHDKRHYWIYVRADVNSMLGAGKRNSLLSYIRPYFSQKEWAVFAADDVTPWIRASWDFAIWVLRKSYSNFKRALSRPRLQL